MGPSNPTILVLANQKGGVGKTTTAINLGTALAALGQRILLVDLDPQGNASTGLGIAPADRRYTAYDLLFPEGPLEPLPTSVPNLWIIPATPDLSSSDLDLAGGTRRTHKMRDALSSDDAPLAGFDLVLIDCPPSLSLLTINAMVAADAVLVPLQCEFFALEGLSQLMRTIQSVRQSFNPDLAIQGVVLTMYDRRNNLSAQVAADVRATLGNLVYDTIIPRNVRLSEAPSHGIPALIYDHTSTGSVAYQRLAAEVLARLAGASALERA
jgi:chromosome partitioning protein